MFKKRKKTLITNKVNRRETQYSQSDDKTNQLDNKTKK